MTWIRVDTYLPHQHEVLAFRERLGVPFAQAVGHVVLLWVWIAEHAWVGDVSRVLDEQLEAAALWRGEEGRCASAFRDCFCDDGGKVKGWLERQGKLIAWKEANRRRKASDRGGDPGSSPNGAGPSAGQRAGQSPAPSRADAAPSPGPSPGPSRITSRDMSRAFSRGKSPGSAV